MCSEKSKYNLNLVELKLIQATFPRVKLTHKKHMLLAKTNEVDSRAASCLRGKCFRG